jgi:hypothetical protein
MTRPVRLRGRESSASKLSVTPNCEKLADKKKNNVGNKNADAKRSNAGRRRRAAVKKSDAGRRSAAAKPQNASSKLIRSKKSMLLIKKVR